MKKIITNSIITISTLMLGNVALAQCSGCEATPVAAQHEHHHSGGHEDHAASKSAHHHGGSSLSKDQFEQMLEPYLATQKALAGDNLEATKAGGSSMVTVIKGYSSSANNALLAEAARMIAGAENLKTARDAFLPVSEIMIASAKALTIDNGENLYLAHCPMAFNNKGGSWLQDESVLANPYWGAMMLRCGTIKPLASK